MKRDALMHTKLGLLQHELGIPKYEAIGILESVWHMASDKARSGAIGRYSDADIAATIGWDGDPAALVSALIGSRWLDTDQYLRLVIHDWNDHWNDPSRKGYASGSKVARRQRMRDAGGEKIDAKTRAFVMKRDGGMCRLCSSRDDLTLDHILAISNGGTHAPENLRVLCRSCNSRKGAR
jgi:hypothetical protein